jgi:hypothetical protein
MEYNVVQKDKMFFIENLKEKYDTSKDTLLICRYEENDCDTFFSNKEQMHSALYDEYQTNDQLHEGDTFVTPFGRFKCVSFHVLSEEEYNGK